MKKLLVPVAVSAVVFGVVTAFAASLNVTSAGLGAGDGTVGACNTAAHVSYDTAATGTAPKTYQVSAVTVTSAASCSGKVYKVTLTGLSGILGSQITGTLDPTGSATTTGLSGVAAEDVTGVAVAITG